MYTVAGPGMGLELSLNPPPIKCRLAHTAKQTGQESGWQLIPQFWILIVLQSESVNCLQTVLASGQPGPKTPYWGFAARPHSGTSVPRPPGLQPLRMKIPGVATEHTLLSEFVVTTMQGFGSLCEKMSWSARLPVAGRRLRWHRHSLATYLSRLLEESNHFQVGHWIFYNWVVLYYPSMSISMSIKNY